MYARVMLAVRPIHTYFPALNRFMCLILQLHDCGPLMHADIASLHWQITWASLSSCSTGKKKHFTLSAVKVNITAFWMCLQPARCLHYNHGAEFNALALKTSRIKYVLWDYQEPGINLVHVLPPSNAAGFTQTSGCVTTTTKMFVFPVQKAEW